MSDLSAFAASLPDEQQKGAVNLDKFAAGLPDAPAETAAPTSSKLDAVGRGLASGATLGFGAAASGGLEAALERIRQYRHPGSVMPTSIDAEVDAQKQADADAHREHPYLYGASQLAGGAPLAVAATPALGGGLAGAAFGGAQGLAATKGDLTTPEGRLEALEDTGKGTAIGAATGAVTHGMVHTGGNIAAGAPARQVARAAMAAEEGATLSQRRNLRAISEKVTATLAEDRDLAKLARKPEQFADALDERREATGKAIGAVRKAVDETVSGIPVQKIGAALEPIVAKLPKAAGEGERAQVQEVFDRFAKHYGDQPAGVSTVDLSAEISHHSKIARAAAVSDPLKSGLHAQIAGALAELRDVHLDAAIETNPQIAPPTAWRDLNRRYSALTTLQTTAEHRALSNGTGTRLSQIAEGRADQILQGASLIEALATHNPVVAAAPLLAKVAKTAIKATPRAADALMASIIRSPTAANIARAIAEGLPEAAARSAASLAAEHTRRESEPAR